MHSDVAVLLNTNAKGVTRRVVDTICEHHPERDVYLSTNEDHASEVTREIMARGYETVVAGGGDGTVQSFLNHSIDWYLEAGHGSASGSYPSIGVLKLGTGNAISAYVGAEQYLPDLERVKAGARKRPLSLIQADGQYCYFAGFGLDAAILQDYREIKDTWVGKHLKYLASIPGLSLPRSLTTRRNLPLARVINRGAPAYRIGPDGDEVGPPIFRGEVLYEGPVYIAGVSTLPYYGYRFKLYPFADRRPGRMQLRVSSAGSIHTLAHLHEIWRGTYRSDKTHDFYCDHVTIELERAEPFQLGGESGGTKSEVDLKVARRRVALVDLTAPAGVTLH